MAGWPRLSVLRRARADRRAEGQDDSRRSPQVLRVQETFTVKIGTVFQESNAPFRYWLQAIYLMCASKKGVSTRQLQRTLGCGMKTAWHLRHRIREMMKRHSDVFSPMGGEGRFLEADVAYVGRRAGMKVRPGTAHVNPVLSLVERNGEVRLFHCQTCRRPI